MFRFISILVILCLSFNLKAQETKAINCNQIPINDSLVVEPGTFFFNNTPINEYVKIYFNENNPPTIETIPNPCSHIHSGYKHAFQIKFTENSQIISANEIIESIQNENPGFAEFQLILNQELIKYL